MQTTRPLFRFDPGWLFVLAGLGVCAAGVLLPAQADLEALHRQVMQLRSEEVHAYARLKAHSDFVDQLDSANPGLIRRLAAAQLNIVPQGDTPVLLSSAETAPVTNWIDATVQVDIRPPKPLPTSRLSRLANGPNRLWMFGAGIMAVFVGLMLGPAVSTRRRQDRDLVEPWERWALDDPADLSTSVIDELSTAGDRDIELDASGDSLTGAGALAALTIAKPASLFEAEPETLDSYQIASVEATAAAAEIEVDDGEEQSIRNHDDAVIEALNAGANPAGSDREVGGCLTLADDDDVLLCRDDDQSDDECDRGEIGALDLDGDPVDDDADENDDDDDDDDQDDDLDHGGGGGYGLNPFRR